MLRVDVNPFLAFADGGLAADCRVSLRPPEQDPARPDADR